MKGIESFSVQSFDLTIFLGMFFFNSRIKRDLTPGINQYYAYIIENPF